MFDPDVLRRAFGQPDRTLPWLRLNFVASLDGAATVGGLSGGLNDPWDLQVFETLRSLADVVLVAAGTVRDEGYDGVFLPAEHAAWRRAHGFPDHPRLAIVTASGDLDPASAPFDVGERKQRPLVLAGVDARIPPGLSDVAEVVVCPQVFAAEPARGHEIEQGSDQEVGAAAGIAAAGVGLHQMMIELHARGLNHVLCEGGPRFFGSLLGEGLVDELCLTLAPVLVGGTARRIALSEHEQVQNMGLVHSFQGGAMTFLRYCRTLGPRTALS